MEDTHLTIELLRALKDADLPPAVLSHITWKHLMALCPECRGAFDEWISEESPKVYRGTLDLRSEDIEWQREQKALEKRIGVEFNELLRTPKDEREKKIANARTRFAHPLLIEWLIDECRSYLHSDPREAVHFASLATVAAKRCTYASSGAYRALSLAQLANAMKATGDLTHADHLFKRTRRLMKCEEVMDSDVHALIDAMEGSLRKDQRRFDEAGKLVRRAVLVYEVLGMEKEVARELLNLAYIYFQSEEESKAFELIYKAKDAVDPNEELELAVGIRHTLASALCDAGDPFAAAKVMESSEELFSRYFNERGSSAKSGYLMAWLEGRIARGLEAFDEAEEKLQEAAQGYGSLGIGYDTALVCLDLAEAYLAQGKHGMVQKVAKETGRLLSANDLTQEAMSALVILERSATEQLLTAETISRLRQRIEEKGLKPGVLVN